MGRYLPIDLGSAPVVPRPKRDRGASTTVQAFGLPQCVTQAHLRMSSRMPVSQGAGIGGPTSLVPWYLPQGFAHTGPVPGRAVVG